MICYKSYRIIDGKPKWVIEDENGDINKSPTKELLKLCIYQNLLLYLKDKEFFGMEDLNNWLKGE
jgi:hypothetical protein